MTTEEKKEFNIQFWRFLWASILIGLRLFSSNCKVGKEKATSEITHLSPLVGIADEISNIKFIEDFDKIVNFMLATVHA